MKKIYIAHPYSVNPEWARKCTDRIVHIVHEMGHLPVSPVHFFGWLDNDSGIREHLLEVCANLLKTCDELWYYGKSNGVDFEISEAKKIGIPIKKYAYIEEEHYQQQEE